MWFLSRSRCDSPCSIFIFTERIYSSRAHFSGGLAGWWTSRRSLETHCLSWPHWEIYVLGLIFFFCMFVWFLLFQLLQHLCPNLNIQSLKWTMFALMGKFNTEDNLRKSTNDRSRRRDEKRQTPPHVAWHSPELKRKQITDQGMDWNFF